MRTFVVALLAACSAVTACRPSPRASDQERSEAHAAGAGSGPKATPAEKPLADRLRELQARMHARFAASQRMLYAIALSDLDRAKKDAQVIVDLDEPDILPEWRPYIDNIQAAAQQVIAVADPVTAARSMAQLGEACGRCHMATHAKLKLPNDQPPPMDNKLRSTMVHHQWAAGRMWDGIVAPSTERWLQGAKALESSPLTITAEVGQPPGELGIADDAARVHLFARRAQTTEDLDARADLYGEMLGTCVHCHYAIRDR